MKKIIIGLLIAVILGGGGWYVYKNYQSWPWFLSLNPGGGRFEKLSNKLEQYDFDSLKKRGGIASEIKYGEEPNGVRIRRENELIAKYGKKKWKKYNVRNFETKTISYISNGKKVTGMINIPMTPMSNKMPAVIMIRGFAESAGYYTGSGTWKVADKLAENGFVTVSLDFLGYGGSDNESRDTLEARFEKVVSVMDLIASVKQLGFVDGNKIGIWAHSNGGQITLSVLEVSGENYPTVMWAPMTNPFPQSVLETADSGPGGDPIRKLIADFQKKYDARRYAFENYYSWINAPIIIRQGTADEWCEVNWQQEVVSKLKSLGKSASLEIYSGDDHNLKNSWNEAVAQDLQYFGSMLKK